ncbi:hypothetical protein AS181_03165 [Gordonia sp. SGD-V-85]|nr:hypothetical protein AS181_03165 [Gordonia sp. SGD-V-85]SCB86616.1 hypothetical protein GA0061091_102225 [Gordonia sp. v-85]
MSEPEQQGIGHIGPVCVVTAPTRGYPVTDEPLVRRSVRDFCRHYGLIRNAYLDARAKAGVRALDHNSMLSIKDQEALLRFVSADRRRAQRMREIREQPVTPRRPVKPSPPPKPPVDVDAEIQRVSASLDKWRGTLVELTREHLVNDGSGECAKCRKPAPCLPKQTLDSLDAGLVEEIAVWDSDGGPGAAPWVGEDPERQLRLLYALRNRWKEMLVRYSIEHMIEGGDGKCPACGLEAPCEIKRSLSRLNRGIAQAVETDYAILDDEELNAAFRPRRSGFVNEWWTGS